MFKRLIKNEDGNFAIIMALALVPVMGAIGAGYDYSMMANKRGKLQKAADTALLAAANDASTSTDFYRLAENYFNTNYQGEAVEYKAKAGPRSVSIRINDRYETAVMGILGVPYLDLEVYSEVAVNKFGKGALGISNKDISQAMKELDRMEKNLLQQIGNLRPRDQERVRSGIKRKFDMLRKQVSSAAASNEIRLIK